MVPSYPSAEACGGRRSSPGDFRLVTRSLTTFQTVQSIDPKNRNTVAAAEPNRIQPLQWGSWTKESMSFWLGICESLSLLDLRQMRGEELIRRLQLRQLGLLQTTQFVVARGNLGRSGPGVRSRFLETPRIPFERIYLANSRPLAVPVLTPRRSRRARSRRS